MTSEKRLIDANALMDKIEGVNWYHINKLGYLASGANSQEHTPIYKAEDIYNAINNAPTVDAVEVVHGRWEKKTADYVYYYACSECGEAVLKSQWGHDFFSDYCSNCGAKMDGGNEDG